MTPPVFVAPPALLRGACPGEVIRLTGAEGRHAATVRRLAPGEPVAVVDGEGARVTGTVADVRGSSEIGVLVALVEREAIPDVPVTVVLALLKGDRLESAVEMLTELGVDEIVPWSASRCIVQWRGERAAKGEQKVRAAAVAASKQSRRARFPRIAQLASTDGVSTRLVAAATVLVLHESAPLRLVDVERPGVGEIVLVIGPEGGLTAEELAAFESVGGVAVRMGPTVQRAATAAAAASSVILARAGRWA